MKSIKHIFCCLPLLLLGCALVAQDQPADMQLPLSYDPVAVLEEWKLWKAGQHTDEALQTFMTENNVPQEGLYGLSLEDTWYWWISTNPEKIEEYLAGRKED